MGNVFMRTKRMKAAALLLLLAPLLLVLGSFYAVAAGDNNNADEHGRCTGSILECGVEMADHEELMEKEYSSRNTRKSCLPPPSNPQNRGCSSYYRCRR
ncbi:protein RALF-like 32 [Juglans microcarpa x Juglans regia]|uniref:protein RALF-like 32 n=1 Tax=Juglans microcarpa x Juglans regia TaxID=2249226 RepID=UPI001B7ED197|nr:protein RALF-like 32 [Juglans microcarpa x Juglans regia]